MRNKQRGFIVPILIIIIVVLVVGGGVYINSQKNDTPANNSENQNMQEDNSVSTTSNSTNNQDSIEILTENDILNATYRLSANLNGTRTPPVDVIFPKSPDKSKVLSNSVSISQNGLEVSSQANKGESFWIYKYEFTNSVYTEATVYIAGNFGASGMDNRMFSVRKVNGKVVTSENITTTTSNEAPIVQNSQLLSVCGFSVTGPIANSRVSFPLVVNGNINNTNSNKSGCGWQAFEGVGGTAQLYFNYNNSGWKPIGQSAFIIVADWTSSFTGFHLTLDFNNSGVGIPPNTPMKIVFTEENAAAIRPSHTYELPIVLK